MIAGKLIFSALGLALTLHPVGVVLGCVFGHLCDQWWQQTYTPARAQAQHWQEFSTYIVYLAACVAKADGVVSKEEIRAFKRNTNYNEKDELLVGQLFNQGWRQNHSEAELIRRLGLLGRQNPQRLKQAMDVLEQVARAGRYGPNQQALLLQAARAWGLSGEKYAEGGADSTYRSHTKEEVDATALTAAYKKLGLKPNAKEPEVKAAYRAFVRQYHPDKARANGASEAAIKKAEDRMADVNAAYEVIRRQGY